MTGEIHKCPKLAEGSDQWRRSREEYPVGSEPVPKDGEPSLGSENIALHDVRRSSNSHCFSLLYCI